MPDETIINPIDVRMTPFEQELTVAITHLIQVREKIGISDDTKLEGSSENKERNNRHIIRYAVEIYKVWAALHPQEHLDFIEDAKKEIDIERPVRQALKAGGYTPISFPTRLDRMFGLLIPGVKTQDKRFWMPLLKHIPELRRSNYV